MSAPIGPGMWVECVRCASATTIYAGVHFGGVYCVEDVQDMGLSCAGCAVCHQVGLRLRSISFHAPGCVGAWICAGAFRPIYRPNEKLIADLLTSVPADPEEVMA